MSGNFTSSIQSNGQMPFEDFDFFIANIITDLITNTTSSDFAINNTIIDRHKKVNLQQVNLTDNFEDGTTNSKDLLITFDFDSQSPYNVDYSTFLSTGQNHWHAVYSLYLTVLESDSNRERIKRVTRAIIDGLTNNFNGGTTYNVIVPSGLEYGSDLFLNELIPFPTFLEEAESSTQRNYITAQFQIIFKIFSI